MTVHDQMLEITKGMGDDIEFINQNLRRGTQTVLGLAALAFEDDGSAEPTEPAYLNWITPTMWPHVKKHLKRGLDRAALSPSQREQWRVALEGAYRMAEVSEIQATEEDLF